MKQIKIKNHCKDFSLGKEGHWLITETVSYLIDGTQLNFTNETSGLEKFSTLLLDDVAYDSLLKTIPKSEIIFDMQKDDATLINAKYKRFSYWGYESLLKKQAVAVEPL